MSNYEKWLEWDENNPEFWNLFVKFTNQAISKGHKKLSAWLIINRIRWETTVETTGNPYKISNNFIAFFSRKFMKQYPQYDGFFKTKKMKEVNHV